MVNWRKVCGSLSVMALSVMAALLMGSPKASHGQAIQVPGKRDINAAAAQRFAGPQPIGTNGHTPWGGTVTLTNTGYTSRIGHIIRYPCYNPQLLFVNANKGSLGLETPGPNAVSWKFTFEWPLGTFYSGYIKGVRSFSLDGIAAGQTNGVSYVMSDPVGITLVPIKGTVTGSPTTTSLPTNLTLETNGSFKGGLCHFTSGVLSGLELYITATTLDGNNLATLTTQAFAQAPSAGDTFTIYPVLYERSYQSVVGTSLKISVINDANQGGGDNSPPFEGRVASSDSTDSGAISNGTTTSSVGACGLYGQPLKGFIPAIIFLGDSRVDIGDPDSQHTEKGFMWRAVKEMYPYVRGGISGETTSGLLAGSGSFREVMATGCSLAFVIEGHNDLATASLGGLKGNILAITRRYNNKGIRVCWCTETPYTTSTNGWIDTANQSVAVSSAVETLRQGVNSWLLDTSAAGYVAQAGGSANATVLDVDSAVECNAAGVMGTNGGFWKPATASVSGTSTGTNSTTTLNDTSKAWTVNQWAGYYVIITGGTGHDAGTHVNMYGLILSNTATALTIQDPWQPVGAATAPDATSAYIICAANATWTGDGVHPLQQGHIDMAAKINVPSLVASVGLSRLFEQRDVLLSRRRMAAVSPAIIRQIDSLVDPLGIESAMATR